MFEITTTQSEKYSVAALNTATNRICKLSAKTNENQLAIALIIYETSLIWGDNSPAEFANVHEWTESAFGIKKTQSNDRLNIGKRFVEKENGKVHTNLLPFDYVDFSISQLIQMLPYDDEILHEMCENGEINPSMSCRAIKTALKAATQDENAEIEEDAEGETESSDNAEIMVEITCEKEGITIRIPQKAWDKIVNKYAEE